MVKAEGVVGHDPEAATAQVFDCFSAISRLNGDIPFDSSERPKPPFWQKYLQLMDELQTAAMAEDAYSVCSRLADLRDLLRSIVSEPTASDMSGDRMLFATVEGRLGVTCGPILPGDGIWVLAGMPYPVILREAGTGMYFVIQCAYVNGIMHGEAVPVAEPPVLVELA
ncbi:uncharacterized protein F5Z01DRAFT_222518 [Emericellopsis atlantica]|uniref:Uncharacterized protein n=1 Tax=Emericellopsis atlantica TaxID=2614577 RepID=A0A9P7ZIE4_9HYPO|nr:uncharacterized protein F5Z01DRAFT_222518 [Emericellopsis atlantica]KAG9252679.1 hypothetical protein F5Z01DRAFT_222518 [Emericellopsis atlantica]